MVLSKHYEFDYLGRLKAKRLYKDYDSDPLFLTTTIDFQYHGLQYDVNHHLIASEIRNSLNGWQESMAYEYDDLGQLTAERRSTSHQGSFGMSYEYDHYGNLRSETTEWPAYGSDFREAMPNRPLLVNLNKTADDEDKLKVMNSTLGIYDYDRFGNMTRILITTGRFVGYRYNLANKLYTAIRSPGTAYEDRVRYIYDGNNNLSVSIVEQLWTNGTRDHLGEGVTFTVFDSNGNSEYAESYLLKPLLDNNELKYKTQSVAHKRQP